MSPADRRPLIVVGLVAAALIALFVVAVAYQPGDRGPGSGVSAQLRERLRAALFPAEPVAPGQLAGCAAAPGPFAIAGSCELRVAPAGARSRRLLLTATDPLELGRTVNADGRRIAMRARLAAGEQTQIFVGEDGEALGLRCLAGLTCRAAVTSPPADP